MAWLNEPWHAEWMLYIAQGAQRGLWHCSELCFKAARRQTVRERHHTTESSPVQPSQLPSVLLGQRYVTQPATTCYNWFHYIYINIYYFIYFNIYSQKLLPPLFCQLWCAWRCLCCWHNVIWRCQDEMWFMMLLGPRRALFCIYIFRSKFEYK